VDCQSGRFNPFKTILGPRFKNLLMVDRDMPYRYSCAEDLGVKALLIEVLGSDE